MADENTTPRGPEEGARPPAAAEPKPKRETPKPEPKLMFVLLSQIQGGITAETRSRAPERALRAPDP